MRLQKKPLVKKLLLEAFLNNRGGDGCVVVKSWNVRRQHLYKLSAKRAATHIICENLMDLLESGEFTAAQLNDTRSLPVTKYCMSLIRTITEEVQREACSKKLRLKISGSHQILAGVRGCGVVCDTDGWRHMELAIRRMLGSDKCSQRTNDDDHGNACDDE